MNDKTRIMLVEDDENMGFLLRENLRSNGFDAQLFKDGESAEDAFTESDSFDLCVLDVMLPKKDGFNLAKSIRKINPGVPIIFLTAKSLEQDRVMGFELGADDYMTKPFSAQELILRIKAILKRINPNALKIEQTTQYKVGKYDFDYLSRLLSLDGENKKVSAKEADLLKIFCENQNQLLNRNVILKTVWGDDDYFTSKSMDVYLTRLRKLLKEDPRIELQNVHGVGYKMVIQ